jgi:hypothetical protein
MTPREARRAGARCLGAYRGELWPKTVARWSLEESRSEEVACCEMGGPDRSAVQGIADGSRHKGWRYW